MEGQSVTIPVVLMDNLIQVLQSQFANYQTLLRQSVAAQQPVVQEEAEGQ